MENKNLEFHIKSDDYFGTLATVIDLQVQRLRPKSEGVTIFDFLNTLEDVNNILEEKVKELMHLQKNYKIVKK